MTKSERFCTQWDNKKKKLDQKYRDKVDATFFEWWSNRHVDDAALQSKAFNFEERYFKDLTMTLREFSRTLTRCEMQEPQSGKSIIEEDGFDQAFDLWLDKWIFTYAKLPKNVLGRCLGPAMTIQIRPGLAKEEENMILLHEMIHAYEFNLERECESFKQYIILWLFNKLVKKVTNLMEFINRDNHVFFGVHSPLFMLKSIDLDLRLKKRLGTIYAYGREEYFK